MHQPKLRLPGAIALGILIALSLVITLATESPLAVAQEGDVYEAGSADAPQMLELSILTILSGAKTHNFTVELADEPAERRQGLMFRRSMGPDHGMLFLYDQPQRVAMWMKNTFIPLDILFLQQDGVVINIARDAEPGSLSQIASKGRVLGALELNAGTSERLGLKPGDQVLHVIFGNAGKSD